MRARLAVGPAPQQVGGVAVEVGVGVVLPAEGVERPGRDRVGCDAGDGCEVVRLGRSEVVGGVDHDLAVESGTERLRHGGDGVTGKGDHDHVGTRDGVEVAGSVGSDAGGEVMQRRCIGRAAAEGG